MAEILFVCTGNTCRSPMAEALAGMSFDGHNFFSRGTAALGNYQASEMAVKVMAEVYGADLSAHLSMPLTKEDVERADIILTMTASHKSQVLKLFPAAAEKAHTIRGLAFCEDFDIDDPFMCGYDVYLNCAKEIKRCLDALDFNSFTPQKFTPQKTQNK